FLDLSPSAPGLAFAGRLSRGNSMATALDKSRVLVVDDEPQIANALRSVLSMQGYHVRTVDEGRAALATFGEWRPELVITDLVMAHMDGIELCRRIRSASNVPII